MSKFWNSRVRNIKPYVPGEQPRERKFIKLNTNENPYPPSPKVIEAIKDAANPGLRLYPDPLCTEFREAAARRYGVNPSQVFAGNGSDEILAFAFGAFFENGIAASPVFFPDITYSFYPVYANLWDIPYNKIPVRQDFSINCADYRKPCGGIVFPNPNAPTGIPIPLSDILSLADFQEGQGSILIVDEAYIAFGAESAVSYINKHPNLLTVHTMSKSASLAGLRLGFAIGHEDLIQGLYRIKDSFNSYTIDRCAMAGAIATFNETAYYDVINRKIRSTREKTAKELRALGFTVLPSAANFLFIKAPNVKGVDLFESLREYGILVRHFKDEKISDFIRITIGMDDEMDILLSTLASLRLCERLN